MDDDRALASAASPTPVVGGAASAYLQGMSEPRETEKPADSTPSVRPVPQPEPKEIGGPKGPEPTRYGDWENKGIVSDF